MNFVSLHEELYNWLNDTENDNEVIRPISKQFLNSSPSILEPLSYVITNIHCDFYYQWLVNSSGL